MRAESDGYIMYARRNTDDLDQHEVNWIGLLRVKQKSYSGCKLSLRTRLAWASINRTKRKEREEGKKKG